MVSATIPVGGVSWMLTFSNRTTPCTAGVSKTAETQTVAPCGTDSVLKCAGGRHTSSLEQAGGGPAGWGGEGAGSGGGYTGSGFGGGDCWLTGDGGGAGTVAGGGGDSKDSRDGGVCVGEGGRGCRGD